MGSKHPATTIGGEIAVVPKRRFPEFRDEPLLSKKLAEVTTESVVRNGEKLVLTDVMGVSKVDGIIPMEERIIASDIARYKIIEHDWFAYNPMRLNIGSIARWEGDREVLVSPDYVVFRCRDDLKDGLEPAYLDHFRRTMAWEQFVQSGGDGSVRVRIYYKDLGRLNLPLPKRAEQHKIAECLTSADELIAAQAEKVEALKAHKKGLMQQLFPRPERSENGQKIPPETKPRRRFPEFEGAGDWLEDRLGKLGTLVAGLTYSPEDVRDAGLLVLRSSNVQNSKIALNDCVFVDPNVKGANLSQPNDILICVRNGSKALIGKSALIPEGMPICTHGAFMTVFRSHAPHFVFQLLQTAEYQKQVDGDLGATINSINGSQFVRYKFIIPKPTEQQRIADFLSSLDDLITAQSQKLDALKTHKKALMQQLFPTLEGVAG